MVQSDPWLAPHWDRAALLTVDVQVDTLDGGLCEVAGSSAVLPAIARAVQAARRARRPIFHLVRLYRSDGSNVDGCRRTRVGAGWHPLAPHAAGSEIAPALAPVGGAPLDPERLLGGRTQRLADREWAVYKPRWGAFFATPLAACLRRLAIDTLIVAGCNYPNCPRASIYEASERDYRVVVLGDAVSGLDHRGWAEMTAIGASLCTADSVVTALAATAGTGRRRASEA